ncbi:MAG TPA: glycosyltransferase [Geobacteraceae bacterium]|nr:glycosyltransferase [Geobacteraceae bacterium]
MGNPLIDIIVAVWNRPVETRNCLVNLMDHSPQARFILVDNGSDRETERLLQEFAEILDHRALLLRNDVNQGYVRAVNRGIARAEAPSIAIIRNSSIVIEGWQESLLKFIDEQEDAGIVVPRLVPLNSAKPGKSGQHPAPPEEADHGSFAAMVLKKRLYDAVGGFDEEMDGGTWCLKDFSRRAYRHGFFTYQVPAGTVRFEDEVPFGSTERRELALKRSLAAYRERWGEDASYCIHFPKGADLNILRQKTVTLLKGARQGNAFTILAQPRLHKELTAAGLDRLHENVRFMRLPHMFEDRAIKDLFSGKDKTGSSVIAVTGIDGMPFPAGIEGMPFTEMERLIAAEQAEKYGG